MPRNDMPKGFKGGYANTNPKTTIATVAKEPLEVGAFVTLTDDGAISYDGSTVSGVVAKSDALTGGTVPKGSNVTLATKADVWLEASEAVVIGTKVKIADDGKTINASGTEVNATVLESVESGLVHVALDL